MNNLIIAKNYETFGDAGLTSNKVIYYKEDNMVKFRANITDNPFGESEVVTVGGIGGIEAILLGESTHWDAPSELTSIRTYLFYTSGIKSINAPNVTSINSHSFRSTPISRFNSDEEGTLDLRNVTSIGQQAFRACNNIRKVYFSDRLNSIGNLNFSDSVEVLNFGNTRNTIPTIEESTFSVTENTKFIVPDALYDQWKVAPVWSNYAENIVKYSDIYPVFYDWCKNDDRNAYINIISVGKYNWRIHTKVNISAYHTNNSIQILGSYIANSDRSITLLLNKPNTKSYTRWFNTLTTEAEAVLNQDYNIWFDKFGLSGDINVQYENVTPPSNLSSGYVYVFRANGSGTLGLFKIYFLEIYDGDGNLILNLKPCYYQGEAGLWDCVNNVFYGNANNTGTLTVGNDE